MYILKPTKSISVLVTLFWSLFLQLQTRTLDGSNV